jgi:hypothetical protein
MSAALNARMLWWRLVVLVRAALAQRENDAMTL